MNTLKAQDIADMIDHSLLNPAFTLEEIRRGCEIAREYRCISVCVRPCDVELAAELLRGSDVRVTTVIGFPHGSNLTAVKVYETQLAIEQGCVEVDVVLNIGRLRSGDYEYVEKDLKAVVDAAHEKGVLVKVILETCLLTDEEIATACEICAEAGADFVKTSTGFSKGGATLHAVEIMKAHCGKCKIKASGGIRDRETAVKYIEAGVSRIGTSSEL